MKIVLPAILAIMVGTGGWAAGTGLAIVADRKGEIGARAPSPAACVDAITIPRMLSYQGSLLDAVGHPVPDTVYFVQFALYADSSGGSSFWSELQTVRTRDGRFAILLGAVTAIESFPPAGSCFLGMRVNADPEMTPRLRIVSAAYAFLARRADTANAAPPFGPAGGSLAGTYPNPTLAQQGATNGQVLKWTGSAWAPRNDSIGQGGGGVDNDWVRGVPDSVLYTIRRLGIARGGADNMLHGNLRHTHINLGVACTTGQSGQDRLYPVIGGGQHNVASGHYSVVAGGRNGTARGYFGGVLSGNANTAGGGIADSAAVVCGGQENSAQAQHASVGGGYQNTVDGDYGTIAGGCYNNAGGDRGFIGGGYYNNASAEDAVIAGGYRNAASSGRATVGGGMLNSASGGYAIVGGGNTNTADGSHAAVVGGGQNKASGNYSLVGGGIRNATSGPYSLVGGGCDDTAHAAFGGALSGWKNLAGDETGDTGVVVSGGFGNRALDDFAAIGGGYVNLTDASACWSTIGGGYQNYISGYMAAIGGGGRNHVSGGHAAVGGGYANFADSAYSVIAGGSTNYAIGIAAAVVGGDSNVAWGQRSLVGGGGYNTALSRYGGVLSGWHNTAGRWWTSNGEDSIAVVCGGVRNEARGGMSFVGGGHDNIADWQAEASVIGGGYRNQVTSPCATVGGGYWNSALGSNSAVTGGYHNEASGFSSAVGGGRFCSAIGHYGFAVGDSSIVQTDHENSAAFNGQITTGDGQLRCDDLRANSMGLVLDHPADPTGTVLNLAAVSSPELLICMRGQAVIAGSGRVSVRLPDYFAALCRNPMIQLTGVGTSDVYVAADVADGQFSIGGTPGTRVYWVVTGERNDRIADVSRKRTPVEQQKTGGLRGHSLEDVLLARAMRQLEPGKEAAEPEHLPDASDGRRNNDTRRIDADPRR